MGAQRNGKTGKIELADAGADVVIADILTSLAEDVVKEIEERGHRALGVKLDVTNANDVQEMISKVTDHFGRIDILINNAGIQCISAAEWGKYNINVNAIAPGIIETDLTRKRLEDKEYFDLWINRTPLERIGKPEDLSGAIIYLSSKASDFVTGNTIMIDGGYKVQ